MAWDFGVDPPLLANPKATKLQLNLIPSSSTSKVSSFSTNPISDFERDRS